MASGAAGAAGAAAGIGRCQLPRSHHRSVTDAVRAELRERRPAWVADISGWGRIALWQPGADPVGWAAPPPARRVRVRGDRVPDDAGDWSDDKSRAAHTQRLALLRGAQPGRWLRHR